MSVDVTGTLNRTGSSSRADKRVKVCISIEKVLTANTEKCAGPECELNPGVFLSLPAEMCRTFKTSQPVANPAGGLWTFSPQLLHCAQTPFSGCFLTFNSEKKPNSTKYQSCQTVYKFLKTCLEGKFIFGFSVLTERMIQGESPITPGVDWCFLSSSFLPSHTGLSLSLPLYSY